MPHDILAEITARRRAVIKEQGVSFGFAVPETRRRPVVPFMQVPGAILEIKRASPSKGMIAPELDAVKTAEAYVNAGAEGVSVLTETDYFHGSLADLTAVAGAVGTRTSVLRKDFLLEADEVNVAYLCGADAVLLIARILDADNLRVMARRAFSLGIAVLLEVREEKDCEKAYGVLKLAGVMGCERQLVLGINARDLATFYIDPFMPVRIRRRMSRYCAEQEERIKMPPVIAESGIMTEEAARFAGFMSFGGVLIGEAAARNPGNASGLVQAFTDASDAVSQRTIETKFWENIADRLEYCEGKRPLVKICGITNISDAHAAADAGADFLGFVFSEGSSRCTDSGTVENIRSSFQKDQRPVLIGVVTETDSEKGREAIRLVQNGILDGIQYHGCRPAAGIPGYAAVRIQSETDISHMKTLLGNGQYRVLMDAFVHGVPGGTGIQVPGFFVQKAASLSHVWLAGGITPDNVYDIVRKFHPELIDVSSGVESVPGMKDHKKINRLFTALKCQ
ncbi:MAG: bifunctional indole-3-glycerol phosphate synthase/phosphoribosylanthranilate isomerase, partial [Treponema sp.]|nr:bifunctional indole-3-glycerol phosphate synthase/phosphoribosylanthranilate isomerase [Treponema sp.]